MEQSNTAHDDFIKAYRKIIGSQIKESREIKGYSQDDLAEMLNVNRSTISKIENGRFSITVDYLVRFSIFLDFEFKVIER